jgi:hypothetical protein
VSSIFGTDTSKFQRFGTYEAGAFEIVNAEDPTMPTKIARNVDDARPWGLYVWVYAGEGGASLINRARVAIDRAGHGVPPLLVWWDYEDKGVAQWQLDDAFRAADSVGLPTGYYSNPGTVDHAPLLARPWWMAAYPGMNDGTFPGLANMRAPRPVNIWQFSSSNGNLDRNIVIDDAWYAGLVTGGDMPFTDADMEKLSNYLFVDKPFGFTRLEVALKPLVDQLATWEQDTRKEVIDTLTRHVDEKLANLPTVAAEGGAMSEQDVVAIINRTKLSAE